MTDNRPRRPAYRKAAAALGAVSALSLAGCSEGDSGSISEPDGNDAGDVQTTPGTGGTDETVGSPSRGDETADVACDEETLDALEDERFGLEEQLSGIEFEGRQLRTGARATEYLLDQLDPGFSAETLERGKSVGLGARPSVVTLERYEGDFPTGQATAWFVDEGHLFTNAHNVHPSGPETGFQGVTHDGDRFDVAVVDLVEDMHPDVALLRTEYSGAAPLPMTAVDALEAGQPLVQVGHPGEVGFWIISMGRFIEGRPTATFDGEAFTALKSVVPGRAGVSGSPVLTLDGDVVGMTHSGEPFVSRALAGPAPVAPDIVFDGPIAAVAVSAHDGSDILERKLEEWR